MPATSAPYGLRPVQSLGSRPWNGGGLRQYALSSNSATGFFFGDMVNVVAGVPTVIQTTPTTTYGTTSTPMGVFIGCSYTSNNFEFFDSYLPANAITGGATNVLISILEDPKVVFQVQGNGAIPLTAIGKNVSLTNFGNGSTTLKLSGVQLNASAVSTASTLAMRIVDIPTTPTGSPGDAYTDCLVVFNPTVHAYENPQR